MSISVAKHRGWFTTYTPFESVVDNSGYIGPSSPPLRVLGIGSVEIPVKRNAHQTGAKAHRILVVNEVLHVPDASCNVIGQPSMDDDDYSISFGRTGGMKGAIRHSAGRVQAYFDPKKKLGVLKLSGPPTGPVVGPSRFNEDKSTIMFAPSFYWEPSEERRWRMLQLRSWSQANRAAAKNAPPGAQRTPPYTDAEKAFLKKHWDGEFKFLLTLELNITDEEDREEGRSILRALMAREEEDEEDDDDDDDDDDEY